MLSSNLIVDYPSHTKFININDFLKSVDNNYYFIIDKRVDILYDFNINPKNKINIQSEERFKSINTVNRIVDYLLKNNCGKDIILVGIGGGIVTDLTGFIASIYKRGIKHILIPTTLLAMVDAAYGAKTAVNFNKIKNALGTIKIPDELLIDINFLKTLSCIEILNGMGEVLKIAITSNKVFLDNLLSHKIEINDFSTIVSEAIKTKCSVIKDDLDDKDSRRILNFGHTIGHIIEINHKIKHGIAISIGGIEELKLINSFLNIKNDIIVNYKSILEKYKFPIEEFKIDKSNIYQLLNDKKSSNGLIDLINVKEKGKSEVIKIDLKFILEYYGLH